jgi:CubicO group peptidase (beta-lactamase class C family)
MKKVSGLLISGALVLTSWSALAADWVITRNPGLTARLDKLHQDLNDPALPGAIIAVLQQDELVFLKGYGSANREFQIPWDPEIRYTFFSTTKSMTCLALFELQRQGKLRIDDPLQRHLPEFPRFDQPITIRHLLNHSSGLWQDEGALHLAGMGASYNPITLDELYALNLRQKRLPYAPGSNFYYNDAGMRIAARVVERVTGLTFAQAMQQLVFKPAAMHSAVIKHFEPQYYPRQASTYITPPIGGEPSMPLPDLRHDALRIGGIILETSGDGAGMGTIRDFVAYARHLTRNKPDGKTLLDDLVQPVLLHPQLESSYRYGMSHHKHRGFAVFSHGGLYGKWIAYVPEAKTWVLSMSNSPHEPKNYQEELLDAVLDQLPAEATATLNDEEQTLLSGAFIEPLSGYVLRLNQGKSTFMFSSGTLLPRQRSGQREYLTHGDNPYVLQQRNGKLYLRYADWQQARELQPLLPKDAIESTDLAAWAGHYHSVDLNVTYEIRTDAQGKAILTIGGGNRASDRFILEALNTDTLEGTQEAPSTFINLSMYLRALREQGNLRGFVLNTENVRDVVFRKVKMSYE